MKRDPASVLPVTALLLTAGMLYAGCAAGSFLSYRMSPDWPRDRDATIEIGDLSSPVTVRIDPWGIPHIEAGSDIDLARAIGWMHGRDRFFEMDLFRRYACGRMAELLGEQKLDHGTTVDLDLSMRGWDFAGESERDAAQLAGAERELMEAYAAGVNAALAAHPPLEYRLLRIDPEPWRVPDSFAVGRLTAWGITHNFRQELVRLVLALHGGIERSAALYPHEPMTGRTSLPGGGSERALPPPVTAEAAALFPPRPWNPVPPASGPVALIDPQSLFSGASNAWVIGGGRTASGLPLVASDPHLSHLLPSIMYQQHLTAPGLDVIGVTVPGLPFVLMGHNRRVAWGITSAVADTCDLFLEQPGPKPGQVAGPTGPERLETVPVVVGVRDGDRVEQRRFDLRRTPRGFAVNDFMPGLLPEWSPLVTLRCVMSEAGGSIRAMLDANRAGDVTSLRRAMLGLRLPVNMVAAGDIHGGTALFATGRVPLRGSCRGTFPAPAWLPACAWSGEADTDRMPQAAGGAEEYFANGNNLVWDPARHDLLFQVDSGPPYRVERILEMIEAGSAHTLDTIAAMQADLRLGRAARLVPRMLADLQSTPDVIAIERQAIGLLAAWDFVATADSPAAAIFHATYRAAVVRALKDEADAAGVAWILSERYSTNAFDQWFDDPDHPAWDDRSTPAVERRPDQLIPAFREAVALLAAGMGPEPAAWRWGTLHDLIVAHPFASRKQLARMFSLPRTEVGGGLDSVWKSHFDLGGKHPFRAMAGPVFRMVIDLRDPDHGLWVIDTGASGWPGSPHFGDQHELWRQNRYLPMLVDPAEVKAAAKAVLTLR